MYSKRSYPVSTAFLLILFILLSTSGSAYAAALAWNTFLGGTGAEWGNAIAVDSTGNSYVCGHGEEWGSPVRAYSAGGDTCVAKLSDNGTLIWNTFLGGSGDDSCFGIAVDGSGNIYVTGSSDATWGSPLQAYSGGGDAFVAKLDSSGALTWNTFLGGTGGDSVGRLALDGSGNIYVTGSSEATWGAPMQAYSGGGDAFVAKLSDNGTLIWNTFLGSSGQDDGVTIAVNAAGSIFMAGYSAVTWGSPVRAYTAGDDAFVAKLDSSGALTWNTFLGGSGGDSINGIAVDIGGNIFVTGQSDATWGTPLRAYTAGYDAIVAQLADNGTLVWNTFLGGSAYDIGMSIALSGNGNLYVTGESYATWGSPVRAYTADQDIFITKVLLPPFVQATDTVFANTEVTQTDISWTRGRGEQCAVFMKQTDNGSAAPVDNSIYTANAAFGSGAQIGSTGWFCVYNGTETSVTVTGLTAESTYRVMVCEYSGPAGSEQYTKSDATGNPANIATLCQLNVIPKKLHKLLSIVEPVKVFVLIGSTDTVFEKTDTPTWDSTAIKPLPKLKISKRIVLSFVFVNPFTLTPGELGVTIGDCMGTIEVKAF